MRSTPAAVGSIVGAVILVTLVSLALTEPVHACSCAGSDSPKNALRKADAVFFGRVAAMTIVQRHPEKISTSDPVLVEFSVSRVWKGPLSETMTVETERSGISCGYEFSVGHLYIVYAYDGYTGSCMRTRPVWLAARDFAALGSGERPESATPVPPTPAPVVEPTARDQRDGGSCGNTGNAARGPADFAHLALLTGMAWLLVGRRKR